MMEHIFKLNAVLIAKAGTPDKEGIIDIDISANGEINLIGASFLLTDVIKALRLNPNNPLDMAAIMVAINKSKEN